MLDEPDLIKTEVLLWPFKNHFEGHPDIRIIEDCNGLNSTPKNKYLTRHMAQYTKTHEAGWLV